MKYIRDYVFIQVYIYLPKHSFYVRNKDKEEIYTV